MEGRSFVREMDGERGCRGSGGGGAGGGRGVRVRVKAAAGLVRTVGTANTGQRCFELGDTTFYSASYFRPPAGPIIPPSQGPEQA